MEVILRIGSMNGQIFIENPSVILVAKWYKMCKRTKTLNKLTANQERIAHERLRKNNFSPFKVYHKAIR